MISAWARSGEKSFDDISETTATRIHVHNLVGKKEIWLISNYIK